MADISGENLVPQGRAGTGAAYILGANVPSALSVIINGQRQAALAAQRAAAARQKEAELIGKRYDEDRKINYDAGGAFQESYNDYVAPLSGQLVDKYTQLRAGTLTRPQLDRDVANMKGAAERERLLSIDRDKNMNAYQEKELATGYRDRTNLRTAFGGTLLTDDGAGGHKRIQAGQYNELTAQQQIDDNPLTYVPDKIIGDQIKRRATSTVAEAYSNGVGGQHGASSFTSNGFVVQAGKDGALQPAKASNGLPVMDYSDVDLQRDRSGDHKFDMAIKRLQLDYRQEQAATPGARDKTDLELYKEAARSYVHFKETQSVGQNAQPRQPRAAAKGAPEAPYSAPTFGEEVRYNLPTPEVTDQPYSLPGVTGMAPIVAGMTPVETQRPDHAVYGSIQPSPVNVSKAGVVTNKHVDAFVPDEYTVVGSDGKKDVRTNNRQGLAGNPGKSYGAFVTNDAAGKELFFNTTKEGEDAVRAGTAKLRVKFDFNQDKDENFAGKVQDAKAALLKERNSDLSPKYPTAELAEAAARKLLKGGTVRTTVVRTPKNFKDIDGLFGDSYAKHQKDLDAQTRRLRAEGPQQPTEATGGAYQRKATTPNQPKSTKPTTGGAY